MDILAISKGRLAVDQVPETGNDLATVVKERVGDGGGVNCEEHAVDEGVACGEVSGGVSLVASFVEHCVPTNDLGNLVTATCVIPNVVIVDGDVSGVPGVGIPDREGDRGGDERAEEIVKDTVERVDKGVSSDRQLVPVPSGEGV